VIHDDILRIAEPEAIAVVAAGVAVAKAHMPKDHIMRGDGRALVCQADAVPGGGLTREGDKRGVEPKPLFEVDRSGDGEDHHPRFLGQDSQSQAARYRRLLVTIVLESGHPKDLAASSAGGISAESFRAGESAREFFPAAGRRRGCFRRLGGADRGGADQGED